MRHVLLSGLLLGSVHAFAPASLARPSACSSRVSAPPVMGRQYMSGDRLLLIDGSNLMSHRKVTKGRTELAAKLAGIKGARTVLVFDGKRGEAASTSGSNPQVVITNGGNEGGPRSPP